MNPFKKFLDLTPKEQRRIVTIIEHVDTDRSKVETNNGDQFIAIGQSVSVGSKAWVEGDKVVEETPNLPFSEVMI